MRLQPRLSDHALGQITQRSGETGAHKAARAVPMVDRRNKLAHRVTGAGRERRDLISPAKSRKEREPVAGREGLQQPERRLADAACGRIDHAQKRHVVVRVGHNAEVRKRSLDLFTLVERRASHDDVGHLRPAELVLDDA